MYGDIVGGFIGSFDLPYGPSADEIALLEGQEGAAEAVLAGDTPYSTMSDWFFQMVFVATAVPSCPAPSPNGSRCGRSLPSR